MQQVERIGDAADGPDEPAWQRHGLDPGGREHDAERNDADHRHDARIEAATGVDAEPLQLVHGLERRRSHRQRQKAVEPAVAPSTVVFVNQEADSEEAAVVGHEQLLEQRNVERQFVGEGDGDPRHNDGVDPPREDAPGQQQRDPGVEHDLDHQRPIGVIHVGLAEHRRRDEQIRQPLTPRHLKPGVAGEQRREEGQRHADDEGRINAAEARDGEADRGAALGRIGDDEAGDREEHGDAEEAVLRDRGQIRHRHLLQAVRRRAPEAVMVKDHGPDRSEPQQVQHRNPGRIRLFGNARHRPVIMAARHEGVLNPAGEAAGAAVHDCRSPVAMPAAALRTTTTSGGARQAVSSTKPASAMPKSSGRWTLLVHTGL